MQWHPSATLSRRRESVNENLNLKAAVHLQGERPNLGVRPKEEEEEEEARRVS